MTKFVVFRSKVTGRYFKFRELDEEDGYGQYEDSVTESDITKDGDLPSLFKEGTTSESVITSFCKFDHPFDDYDDDEIEVAYITVTIDGEQSSQVKP